MIAGILATPLCKSAVTVWPLLLLGVVLGGIVPKAFVDGLGLTPVGAVIALVIDYRILGTAMDAFATMVITVPIWMPLVTWLGFDPIWWGLMTIMCCEAG